MTSYNDKYQSLIQKLNNFKNKENSVLFINGLLNGFSASALFLMIAIAIELVAKGDVYFRTVLFFTFISLSVLAFGIFLYKPVTRMLGILNAPTIEDIALRVGNSFNDLGDRLLNGLQIVKSIELQSTSQSLSIASFEQIYSIASTKNFDELIEKKETKRNALIFFFLIALFSVLMISNTNYSSAFNRLSNFSQSFIPPAPFSFEITPKNAKAIRGENITIKVQAKGIAPDVITLYIKEENQTKYDAYKIRIDSNNCYYFTLNSIKNSVEFYAFAEWAAEKFSMQTGVSSEIGKIQVVDQPIIKNITGSLTFPSYSRQPSRKIDEQSADIVALVGSSVSFRIESNKTLDSAYLCIKTLKTVDSSKTDSALYEIKKLQMSISDKFASIGYKIDRNCTYYFEVKDKNGLTNVNPIEYKISLINDEFPQINLLTPSGDVKLTENAILPMKIAISDDYGFSKLQLHYRLTKSAYSQPETDFKSIELTLTQNELAQEIPYIWDLKKLNISPEDEFEFYLTVSDNDYVHNYKTSKTNTLKARLPSLDEVLKSADEKQKEVQKKLENILKETQQVKKDLDELSKELKKDKFKDKADWEDKKKAENLMNKQKELTEKMKDAQKTLQDATKELQDNNLLSPETLEKFQELQKMMSEVRTPEMMKKADELKKNMEQMTPDQIQKAMEQFKMTDEQFKQKIERTMKMLEKMKVEQKADALSKKSEQLAKEQDELKKELNDKNKKDSKSKEELAKKQEQLKKELNNIDKDFKEFEKEFKKFNEPKDNKSKDAPAQKEQTQKQLDNLKSQLKKEETEKEMKDAEENIEKGDFSEAQENQEKAEENLKNFSKEMKKMKKQMSQTAKKEAMKKIQKNMNDLFELSKQQEQLRNQTQQTDSKSTQVPDMARKQEQIKEAASNLQKNMQEAAQKSFSVTPEMLENLSSAMQDMEKSTDNLAERNMPNSTQSQNNALSKLNQGMKQMQNMMSQMQGDGKKGKGGKKKGQDGQDGEGGEGEDGEDGDSPGGQGGMQQKLEQAAAEQQQLMQSLQKMMQQQGRKQGQGKDGTGEGGTKEEYRKQAEQQGRIQKTIEEAKKEEQKFAGSDKRKQDEFNKLAEELKELVQDLQSGKSPAEIQKKQEKILSRLLDATRSENERDYETKRESKSGKDLNSQVQSDKNQYEKSKNFQDLLKSLKLGYSKDYENLIKKYFDALNYK